MGGLKFEFQGDPKPPKLEEMAIFRTDFCTEKKLVFLKFFRAFTWIT